VMGVQGVGEYERGAFILSPPLGGSLVSFCPGRKKLAPQGEIPLRTTNAVRNPSPHPTPSGPPIPIPFGLPPSPLDKGSRPPRGGRLKKRRRNSPAKYLIHRLFIVLLKPLHIPQVVFQHPQPAAEGGVLVIHQGVGVLPRPNE